MYKVIKLINQTGLCCQEYGTEIIDFFAIGLTEAECVHKIKEDIRFQASCEPDSGSVPIFLNGNYLEEDDDIEEFIEDIGAHQTVLRLQADDIYSSVYEITYQIFEVKLP